jgi:membrane protease YdiL (CAAX protease family)
VLTLFVVLAFPALLAVGYGAASLLCRRRPGWLAGWPGLLLYLALLTVPLAAVLAGSPGLLARGLAPAPASAAWAAAGVAVGLALWVARRPGAPVGARPGSPPPRVWVGAPGWAGYAALMPAVAYVVVAEELVWRGYLLPRVGPVLAAAAFALHHYHFGARHVVFAFAAGLAWEALALSEGRLYAAVASHLTYDALAWAWLRRRSPGHDRPCPAPPGRR